MIKLTHETINKITIYPFGGMIDTDIKHNINSNKLFLISISGITMQLILFLLIKNKVGYTYDILNNLNTSIILFNILPIYPSDGFKVITSILERFMSYKITIILTNIISIICIFIIFSINKNIFLFIILYYLNTKYIYLFKYILNKFKLERYLYKPKYKKRVYINSEERMKKCRNNYIKCDNIYIEEEAYLNKKFGTMY